MDLLSRDPTHSSASGAFSQPRDAGYTLVGTCTFLSSPTPKSIPTHSWDLPGICTSDTRGKYN